MAAYKLRVNGNEQTVDSWDPNQPILYLLRNEPGLQGPRFGGGLAQCGACTILTDGKVTTLEGLGTPPNPHPIQAALAALIPGLSRQ